MNKTFITFCLKKIMKIEHLLIARTSLSIDMTLIKVFFVLYVKFCQYTEECSIVEWKVNENYCKMHVRCVYDTNCPKIFFQILGRDDLYEMIYFWVSCWWCDLYESGYISFQKFIPGKQPISVHNIPPAFEQTLINK